MMMILDPKIEFKYLKHHQQEDEKKFVSKYKEHLIYSFQSKELYIFVIRD